MKKKMLELTVFSHIHVPGRFLYYLVVYLTKHHMYPKLNFDGKVVIMFINRGKWISGESEKGLK